MIYLEELACRISRLTRQLYSPQGSLSVGSQALQAEFYRLGNLYSSLELWV